MLRFRGTALIHILFFCALASRAVGQTATLQFVDGSGQPASSYLEVTRAYLRVVDPGANQNGSFAEAVSVELSTEVWSDQESVTLQETGPGTGVFEGSIGLKSAGPVVPDNGVLETGVASGPPIHYDTLTASYTDSAAAVQTATASTLGYRVWFLDAAGNMVNSYIQGARVYVRLEDHNNNNPTWINTLYVELSSSSGDQEYLQISETGLATGIYEGSIPLDGGAAAPGDASLQAQGGDQITADRLGAWFPAPALAVIDSASLEFVDGAGLATSEVLVNGTARVRVTSPQANANPSAAETLTVQLSTLYAGDQETVLLTETGPNTGLFVGSIQLLFNFTADPQSGALETATNRQALPEEITAAYGTYSATAHTTWFRVSFLNLRDQEVTSYSLRSLIRVQVENQINNDPGQIDTLQVALTSPGTGDAETVTATETGADTGIFLGLLPSLETGGSSNDGALSVGAGQTAVAGVLDFFGRTVGAQALFTANFVPVAVDDVMYTEVNTAVSRDVLYNDHDAEGSFSLAAVTQGAKGSVVFDAYGDVTYTPNPGTFGQDTFTYLLVDEQGGEGFGTVTVTVNGTPVANDDVASVDEDGSVVIPVLDNDSDPESYPLGVSITTPPAHGTAASNPDGTVTYTPAANFNGTDTFTYEVRDQYAATASATVTLTVNPVNDPPVARADTSGVLEDDVVTVRVLDNDTDLEGDPLSVLSVTQPAQGTVQINPDQTLRYAPSLNFSGTVSFTYTVSDGNGGTATAAVTVNVVAVNDPPVARADTATVAEDGTVNVVVLANDTDVENNTLTLVSVTQGAHGTVLMNLNKTVKYTPAANYNGPDSFTYTISDGLATATATVTMTITSVNDAPVAINDSSTLVEDGTVNVAVLANDTDVDGDTLTVTAVTQGEHGAVSINPDKSVKYTPAANFSGGDLFTYIISDGHGRGATGVVTVFVTPVNDPPIANADSATVAEDGTVNVTVLTNDTDADSDTLTVASATQGAHGAVVINPNKTVKYTPATNYNGADSFTYRVSDGNGGTATATVTITVTSVNDAPVANADAATVAEDGTVNVTVLANDTDADGDTLTVASVTQGVHGAVAINPDKTVKYTPAANYNGADSFTYTISDGNGGTATATVTIAVTSVNDAPVANADAATVAEDGTVNVTVLTNDTDADGDTLTVASVAQGTHGAVSVNANGTVAYTPTANYNGADSFTYTVSDGNGGTATATVTITVTSVNDAPVASADAATVAEDGTVNVAVLTNDTDADGDTLTVASVTQGTHGAVSINANSTVAYTPDANYNGSDSFTYTISDGNGGTATATVMVTVTSSNDAPVANADTATVAEDGTTNVTVLTNDTDTDGDTLTVASVTQGAHGSVVINPDKTVKYTPAANYNGPDSFTYTVSDGNGGTAIATVTITVTSINDAPVASADAATVSEDGTVNVTVLANDTDADGDALAVALVTQGTHGAVSINANGTVAYTPAANYNGSDSFTYTISDGNGGTATATVSVTVTASNDAPVANADTATVAEDGTTNVTVLTNDTDTDGDTLTVASVTQGAHGSVVINPDKTVKYTPAANYNGSDSFTYTISDGNGGTATATVTVTVTSSNDAPVANADTATVAEDGTTNLTVLTNDTDADGDTLTVASVTQGAHGSVVINPDKTVKYTPAANYNGADSFTYTVSDGNGGTATATVTITVSSINDAPVANADTGTVAEDGLLNVAVLANDSDPDGNVLSVASVAQGAHGSVVINLDKTVKYTPAANYNGSDSFTYTISDGNGGTATAAVTINVTPVNDAPVAVNDSTTVVAGSAATVSVLANDADLDGPSLAVTSVTQGAHGAVAISGSQVTYTAALYVGADSFTYTVSDGAGGTATATVTVNVTAPPRVATGIQARYDFNEGSGSTVNDTSGVGTPLNLTIASTSAVNWASGKLTVNTATSIASPGSATKIISAAQAGNALTVEAWIQPASLTLTGPARILTLTKTSSQRNLVFGQSGSRYETQLKTSTGTPALQSPASSLSLNLTHVVYTRTSAGQAIYYINGVQAATATTTGTFATWGTDHKLILSDNWQGSYFLMAVYGRALTSAEVQQNYLAGAN